MEKKKETKQRKPYNRVRCKLIDFGRDSVMFTASGTDMGGGLSPISVSIYESIQRMYEYGQTHPYTGTSTDEYERYKNYTYDPFYDYWFGYGYPLTPDDCALVPIFDHGFKLNFGYEVATRYGGLTMGEFRQVFPPTMDCASKTPYHPVANACGYCC